MPESSIEQAAHKQPRCVAFYLPQFHPIPENDRWWGPGFTEWANVARGRPLFRGHEQPKLPGELGFYDLRLPETRQSQADLAQSHGVDAFCYYHFWFNGRRLLKEPLDRMLACGRPDMPFLLCWANENWTRVWDGGDRDILIAQHYSDADDVEHARFLASVLDDHRYVRLDRRPVLLVYRAGLLPDPIRTTETWRREITRLGVSEPYLCSVESFPDEVRDPSCRGFDASVEFAPQFQHLPRWRRTNMVLRTTVRRHLAPSRLGHHIVSYDGLARRMRAKPLPPYPYFRTVTPGWDNTARRRVGGLVLKRNSPQAYEAWLREVTAEARQTGRPFVFVNAWNEWAEGAYLEPDRHHGRAFLEAHARAVRGPW